MSWVWGTGIRGEPTDNFASLERVGVDHGDTLPGAKPGKVAHFLGGIVSELERPVSGPDFHNHGIMIGKAESKTDITKANSQPHQDKEK